MMTETDAPHRHVAFTVGPVNASSVAAYPSGVRDLRPCPTGTSPSPDGPRPGWVSSPYGATACDPFLTRPSLLWRETPGLAALLEARLQELEGPTDDLARARRRRGCRKGGRQRGVNTAGASAATAVVTMPSRADQRGLHEMARPEGFEPPAYWFEEMVPRFCSMVQEVSPRSTTDPPSTR